MITTAGEKAKMGEFVNPVCVKILGWLTATIIIVLNLKLLFDTFMPVGVEFCPEARSATAKSVLATPTPRVGLSSCYAS